MWYYILFHLRVFLGLIKTKPNAILYYETLSSLAPIIYCGLKKWKVELFIHYHEYTTPEEYKSGMKIGRIFHFVEKKYYDKATWISQTNSDRLGLFRNDYTSIKFKRLEVLANYPPASWAEKSIQRTMYNRPIKIVYVGAFSNDTMYINEFAEWVLSKAGLVHWDIYSSNFDKNTRNYINALDSTYIKFYNAVEYDNLPSVLINYDIGIILYKGHILNYVYNVPNKFFEYLACGLDVWYPKEMLSCNEYKTVNTYPKVIEIDFNKLDNFNLEETLNKQNLAYEPFHKSCEVELKKLIEVINAE
jgi:hypothetical protein